MTARPEKPPEFRAVCGVVDGRMRGKGFRLARDGLPYSAAALRRATAVLALASDGLRHHRREPHPKRLAGWAASYPRCPARPRSHDPYRVVIMDAHRMDGT